MRFYPMLLSFFLLMIAPVQSADFYQTIEGAVKAGDTIPNQIEGKNAAGEPVNFNAIKGENGAILIFSRSLDWCPFCQSQALEWDKRAGEFEERGYNVAVITYDSPEKLQKFETQYAKQNIATIADEGSKIIESFGILNTEYEPGFRFYGIPYPGIYVVDANGTVKAVFSEEGYKNRPQIDDVKKVIQ